MLNYKNEQSKLFIRITNLQNFLLNFDLKFFVIGHYYKTFVLNNFIICKLMIKSIRFINVFLNKRIHIFIVLSENISFYFLLQLMVVLVKTKLCLSVCQEKHWTIGNLKLKLLNSPIKKLKMFQLLVGFNSKPGLVLLFGVSNFFIIHEFISKIIPVFCFYLNVVYTTAGFFYIIPKTNTFLIEDLIFVFVLKYVVLQTKNQWL